MYNFFNVNRVMNKISSSYPAQIRKLQSPKTFANSDIVCRSPLLDEIITKFIQNLLLFMRLKHGNR